MAFPTTGIIDDFNRADNADLGANWTPDPFAYGGNPLKILSNKAAATAANDYNEEYWNAATFGPDSEVYLDSVTKPSPFFSLAMGLRITSPEMAGAADGYWYEVLQGTGGDTGGIYRVDDGAFTVLGSFFGASYIAGDSLGLEAIGSTLKAYKKTSGSWIETDNSSRTEGTYSAAGYLSCMIYHTFGRIDSVGGGTVVVETGQPTIRRFGLSRYCRPVEIGRSGIGVS